MDTNTNTNIDINEQNQGGENNSNPNLNPDVKTYTAEEVAKLIQAEADRRTNQALAKQQKKYEKQLSLSNLDEAERTKAEKDMRIQELEEQLKEYTVLQNKNEVIKVLTARKLNPAFAELIAIGDDLEEAQKKIESLDKLFKTAVQEEVKNRLAGGTPKTGLSTGDEITVEQFKKMTLAQQSELYKNNPELFRKLAGK